MAQAFLPAVPRFVSALYSSGKNVGTNADATEQNARAECLPRHVDFLKKGGYFPCPPAAPCPPEAEPAEEETLVPLMPAELGELTALGDEAHHPSSFGQKFGPH